MISVAISFIAGISANTLYLYFPVTLISVFIISFIYTLFRFFNNYQRVLLFSTLFISGFLYPSIREIEHPPLILPDGEVFVVGDVVTIPDIHQEKLVIKIDGVRIEGKAVQGKLRLILSQKNSAQDLSDIPLVVGDSISVRALLRSPNVYRNPGLFTYNAKRDEIVAVGTVKYMNVIQRGMRSVSWISRNRQLLAGLMDRSLSQDSASFLKAIVPGLKGGLKKETRELFSSTGLAHLLSISGTHFGLLAFLIFRVIKLLIKCLPYSILNRLTLHISPTQVAILIVIPVLVLYALISGMSTPTVRSLIMITIYLIALFLGRKDQWLNSLLIAAVIILLMNPGSILELSFQLSFMAVLSIGSVLEKMKDKKDKHEDPMDDCDQSIIRRIILLIYEKIKTALSLTGAAVIGTAPVVVLIFKQFPLIAPISNIIITPIVCFAILPLGFFMSFMSLGLNLTIMPLHWLIDSIMQLILWLIKIFSYVPYANLRLHSPSVVLIVLFYLSTVLLLWKDVKFKFLPIIIVLIFYFVSPLFPQNNLTVEFLDVGQGDASVVKLPDRKIMLIDGGSTYADAGRRIIAPYLWSIGVRRIDYLVLSHAHPDHYGGFLYIMDNFPIGELWIGSKLTDRTIDLSRKIREKKISLKYLKRGSTLNGKGYDIVVLHPYSGFSSNSPRGDYSIENNNSLVFKIQTMGGSVIFTGDIEREAEEDLLSAHKWLNSDVIKVPHHGGRSSSSHDFLDAVSPAIAVFSVGRNNPFHHPHSETIKRYRSRKVNIVRIDESGFVRIEFDSNTVNVGAFKDNTFRIALSFLDEINNLKLLF